ncbi:MiaB/RimO family radical SAM methylthiotransferase [Patescibacteria group bacterium]|nr:MiaB/RimO family radical SAM methylthiotransferase [Patescibacteria group bacterium]MBU1673675.1 MiaB/RimO family radical SAM methylthiotransferase [Patescibacteria group bacterium]MBU1963837.1 MiaB/RimO family radical SAM methylthiotransferase [Patescibacteria group bacterium]
MNVLFKTLGCRLNQAEEYEYKKALAYEGFLIVSKDDDFDIAVVNTCSVTHKADRESRQAIRQLKKKNPDVKVVMTGCCDFNIPEVEYYIEDKENFVERFLDIFPSPKSKKEFTINKNRINVKIQTGCDNYCTYCITTHRRGPSRSIDPEKIISQIQDIGKNGFKEIVITGVNIGQYESGFHQIRLDGGHSDVRFQLLDLLKLILEKTKIERVRLSSINPEYIFKNQEFIGLFKDPRMCQHLHLSLQSGSDKILKSMNRHYDSAQYLKVVKSFYQLYPDFGFTTDVIVGFPGETTADYADSTDLVKKCKFLKLHIFRYSPRPGTPAAEMDDQIDEPTKAERATELEQVNQELKQEFQKRMIGKNLDVLFEGERDGYLLGTAGNFLKVKIKSKKDIKNQVINLKIKKENII